MKTNLRAGFSLVEMILAIAVLGILVGMSFPAVTRYAQRANAQQEQNLMIEVRNGINAFIADKNNLPGNLSASTTWAQDLSGGYTNLTLNQIQNDVWGRPRAFRSAVVSQIIQGSPVNVNYYSLHSMGPDGVATAVSGTAVSANGAYVAGNTGWWSGAAPNVVTAFSNLVAADDDLLMKGTDYTSKLNNYELTVQRIDKITTALEAFAKTKYTAQVGFCNANPTSGSCATPGALELINYFPRSAAIQAVESSPASTWNYFDATVVVDNADTVGSRRTQMQNLMKLLGLPLDNCCSAIELASDNQPAPLYYFSNPRERSGATSCSARPTGTQTKLPPRIVTTNVADGSAGATCG